MIKTLEITTNIGCPVRCSFCPQSTLISKYKKEMLENYKDNRVMSIETFKSCLSTVPKEVRIDFSGMAEPFAAPDCSEMILHASEKGHSIALYTTLYDANERDVDIIYKTSGISHIEIHLPDEEGNFKATITEDYIRVLKYFYEHPQYSKQRVASMCMSNVGTVSKKISHIVAGCGFWNPITRAGNLFNEKEVFHEKSLIKRRLSGPIYCHAGPDLDHNVLLPNGDVYLCCMDYGLDEKLGNLMNETYSQIYDSRIKKDLINRQRVDNGEDLICRYCDCARSC